MPWVPARLVPPGTVVKSRYEDWGVVTGWTRSGYRRFDRWHGHPVRLGRYELVHVPVQKLVPEPIAEIVRPIGKSIISRVAGVRPFSGDPAESFEES